MGESLHDTIGRFNRYIDPPMPKRLPEDQDLFRVKDAAPYFDVHEKTLREMIRRGEVTPVKSTKPGTRKTYIAKSEIRRYWREETT